MAFDWLNRSARTMAQDPRRSGGVARGMQQRGGEEGAAPQRRGPFMGGPARGALLGGGPLGARQGGGDRGPMGAQAKPDWKAYGESARGAWGDFLRGPAGEDGQRGRRFLPKSPDEWKTFLGQRKQAFQDFRNPKPKAKDEAPAPAAAAAPAPVAPVPEPAPVAPMALAAEEPVAPVPEPIAPAPEPLPPPPQLVAPGVFEQAPIVQPEMVPEAITPDGLDEQDMLRRYLSGGMGV